MKITIRDFRGIADFSAEFSPILLVAGDNGAGKSSVCLAAASAAGGRTQPFGLTKAETVQLVRDGGKEASIQIEDGNGAVHVSWPRCERSERGRPPWASPVASGFVDPVTMTALERIEWLQLLMPDASPDEAAVMAALKETGAPDDTAARIWQMIVARGWDAAQATVREEGTKLKGAWERATGTKYGVQKGASWRPEGWRASIDAAGVDDLRQIAADAANRLEEIRRAKVETEGRRRHAEGAIARGAETARELDQARAELDAAIEAHKAAKGRADALAPPAEALFQCPCCAADLALINGRLIARPEKTSAAHEAADAGREVTRLSGDIRVAKAAVERREREIELAVEAEAHLREMPALPDIEVQAELERHAKTAAEDHRMKRDVVEATDLHERIVRATMISKLLAPDGLRMRALDTALHPFNAALKALCDRAGFEAVAIGEGGARVTYGGRLAALRSAGEQYRIRAVLAIASAARDGSGLVILDGADVLDNAGRNGLFRLLDGLGLPTIVGMTILKRRDMPDLATAGLGTSHWLEKAK